MTIQLEQEVPTWLAEPMGAIEAPAERTAPGMVGHMRCAAEDAAGMLSAIGSFHRLLILCALMEGDKTVTEICRLVDLRQSTASQHLSRLREDGLVRADRQGRFVVYSLANAAAHDIMSILYRHFCLEGRDVGTRAQRRRE